MIVELISSYRHYRLPKLDPGISIKDELYIKKGRVAKLSPQAVAVVDDAKAANNALVSLQKVKEEPKPLTRKERQLVNMKIVTLVSRTNTLSL
jgi:hypothetical protein